jgi:hypothetical protein
MVLNDSSCEDGERHEAEAGAASDLTSLPCNQLTEGSFYNHRYLGEVSQKKSSGKFPPSRVAKSRPSPAANEFLLKPPGTPCSIVSLRMSRKVPSLFPREKANAIQ